MKTFDRIQYELEAAIDDGYKACAKAMLTEFRSMLKPYNLERHRFFILEFHNEVILHVYEVRDGTVKRPRRWYELSQGSPVTDTIAQIGAMLENNRDWSKHLVGTCI